MNPTASGESPAPKRGRPARVDAAELGLVAVRLFVERGIDNVTMDEVARAGGVSRRTLFRLFPSKAAIVWSGFEEITQAFTAELTGARGADVVAILHGAWVTSLRSLDASTEVTRLRMLLISSSPGVLAWGVAKLHDSSRLLQEHINRIDGSPVDSLRARLLSTALMAAVLSALSWWAQTDDPRSPAEVIDHGLAELTQIFASEKPAH